MDKVIETILTWFNPIYAGAFLVCLGVFAWLSSRAHNQGAEK